MHSNEPVQHHVKLSCRGQSPLESGPPGPNFTAIPGPPLLQTVASLQLPLPQRLHIEDSLGHCLFDQNKMRQHLLKSLQEGEMTPIPLRRIGIMDAK